MSEFNFILDDQTDENEIDRIQQEISKDLESEKPSPAHTEGEEVSFDGADVKDTAAAMPAPSAPAYTAPVKVPETDSFYMETVKHEKRKTKKGQWRRTIVAALIVAIIGAPLAGLCIGAGQSLAAKYLGTQPQRQEQSTFSFSDNEAAPISVAPNPSSIIDDFSAVVEVVEPSVVGITSLVSAQGSGSFFFPSAQETPSKGSGIIFDEDDENVYIVTNYHVIGGANTVSVSVEGSDVVNAHLVGAEENSDLAVISILKAELAEVGVTSVKVAKFGDSENIKVGQIVLAIGNALGEGNTATLGMVSAKNKEINVEGLKLSVMQTDAAINPGNSGGPLVNTKGEVIAINTAKFQYYEVEGTGYSIRIDEAKPIIEQLRNRTAKAFLGITMQNMTEETASMYNLPMIGVLVIDVMEGSAAEKAGIKPDDIITGFNGQPVLTNEGLSELVEKCSVGDEIEVKLYRLNEGPLTVNVKLGERPMQSSF
ncbi:MAG: trypsin-like peptidase domain-containing protein [Clostridiales bacterium]|jgi:serine protease Do|nr:trypsin-like peptidase domain-containing protein [Clostridiales bacterium]